MAQDKFAPVTDSPSFLCPEDLRVQQILTEEDIPLLDDLLNLKDEVLGLSTCKHVNIINS